MSPYVVISQSKMLCLITPSTCFWKRLSSNLKDRSQGIITGEKTCPLVQHNFQSEAETEKANMKPEGSIVFSYTLSMKQQRDSICLSLLFGGLQDFFFFKTAKDKRFLHSMSHVIICFTPIFSLETYTRFSIEGEMIASFISE